MTKESSSKGHEKPLAGFLTANATLVAWLVFLGFGSAFLAFYYSRIHYFPELKWEESLSYLAGVSVLGGGIVAIYGLLLFVPGWIWSEFLIFDTELERGALCYYFDLPGNLSEPCFWSILHYIVLPFALLMAALHLALFTGDLRLSVSVTVVGLIAIGWHSFQVFLKELKEQGPLQTTASRRSLLMKYVLTADVAALASATSLFVLSRLLDPNPHSGKLLTVCTAWVVASNLLVAVQFRQYPSRAIVTSIIAAITLMICAEFLSDHGSSQSERLMAGFGVGDSGRMVSLELTERGEAVLRKHNLAPQGMVLLSRLGNEFLVEGTLESDGKGKAVRRRIALPKELVTSWSTIEPDPPSPRPFSFWRLGPFRKVAYVLDMVFALLAALWFVWTVRKKWPDLKEVLKPQPPRKSQPKAVLQEPSGSCESQIFVEVNRTLSMLTESGNRP